MMVFQQQSFYRWFYFLFSPLKTKTHTSSSLSYLVVFKAFNTVITLFHLLMHISVLPPPSCFLITEWNFIQKSSIFLNRWPWISQKVAFSLCQDACFMSYGIMSRPATVLSTIKVCKFIFTINSNFTCSYYHGFLKILRV